MLFTICILTRFILFLGAQYGSPYVKQIISYLATLIALGFTSIYLFGLRPNGTDGIEAVVWWNHLRPIHALLFGLYAYTSLVLECKCSAFFLLADVFVGIASYLTHYKNVIN